MVFVLFWVESHPKRIQTITQEVSTTLIQTYRVWASICPAATTAFHLFLILCWHREPWAPWGLTSSALIESLLDFMVQMMRILTLCKAEATHHFIWDEAKERKVTANWLVEVSSIGSLRKAWVTEMSTEKPSDNKKPFWLLPSICCLKKLSRIPLWIPVPLFSDLFLFYSFHSIIRM